MVDSLLESILVLIRLSTDGRNALSVVDFCQTQGAGCCLARLSPRCKRDLCQYQKPNSQICRTQSLLNLRRALETRCLRTNIYL